MMKFSTASRKKPGDQPHAACEPGAGHSCPRVNLRGLPLVSERSMLDGFSYPLIWYWKTHSFELVNFFQDQLAKSNEEEEGGDLPDSWEDHHDETVATGKEVSHPPLLRNLGFIICDFLYQK